jgi:hypothetical protein
METSSQKEDHSWCRRWGCQVVILGDNNLVGRTSKTSSILILKTSG